MPRKQSSALWSSQKLSSKAAFTIKATFREARIVRPRFDPGIDWSRERLVLVQLGKKELWWMRSGRYWSGIGENSIAATELRLVDFAGATSYAGDWPEREQTLHEGGRFSKQMLLEHGDVIDEWFDFPHLHEVINYKHTLVKVERVRRKK